MITSPYEPLSVLFLFPAYQTREEYEAKNHQSSPPFDPTRPTKAWEDLAVPSKQRVVLYDRVLAVDENNNPLADENGKPFFEPLLLSRPHAVTVNIPLKKGANEHPSLGDLQVPCRALEGDEELAFQPGSPFRVPMVHRPSLVSTDEPVSWSRGDRELLRRIATKLEV